MKAIKAQSYGGKYSSVESQGSRLIITDPKNAGLSSQVISTYQSPVPITALCDR